ncbi:heme biosynthesis protein HemY [Bartonella tamiae]|uniref:HemY N-terminal domain-containing protein n=1 Tax=Bartonella tamiae Th239 TaxID=1094558 RepID=J0R742_9HYPH|nr:heme biosynthesis HemY N-terminal domain-containing protein [Bartonella tamiae]EJF91544.1 hypothetical protein ME5_00239 [Bartonella tamiae Th239]EJF92472.1 hypothetical protein MEG_01642 [Bartonella tamiae Th307]
MIRVLLYVILVACIGAGFAWIASNPSDLVMTFGDHRITFSLLTAVTIFAIVLVVLWLLTRILRLLFATPKNIARHFDQQRQKKGQETLSNGLLAVLSGDVDTARRMNKRALKYLGDQKEPLVKLLEAKTHLLENDIPQAIRLYEQMSKDPKTRLVGLYGLYQEAIKSNAYEAAGQYAEQATLYSPSLQWANHAMLNRLSADGAWDKAITLFERAEKALPKDQRGSETLRHEHAVLLTGKAMDIFENYPEEARKFALKAQKLDPLFVPATVVATDILYHLHEQRKADKLIEGLWKKKPHPDLVTLYLGQQEKAVDRLKRAKRLASFKPDDYESMIVVARAAYDSGEHSLARKEAEKAAQHHQRESAYLLLADIEEAQSDDQGRIRQYLQLAVKAERDPVWIADGVTFDEWAPVSPLSGRLDAFEWKVPARQLGTAIDSDEILPSLEHISLKATDEETKISDNAAIENMDQTKEVPQKKDQQKKQPIDASIVRIVDAIDPAKKDVLGDQTRLNVDDPGVETKK